MEWIALIGIGLIWWTLEEVVVELKKLNAKK